MTIKRDFRTLAPATQAELRRVAVAMVRAGKTRIEAAEAVGVNRRFVGRWVKAAAQHGSGVHSLIDAIARKNGFDEEAVTAGYLQSLELKEKMGSSQRYGYMFEKEQKMWIAEPHVQMYLDSLVKG